MIRELATWWAQQMRGMLPAGTGTQASGLLVQLSEAGTLALVLRRGRRREVLGQGRLEALGPADIRAMTRGLRAPGPVLVELPATEVLEQPVCMPLAAEAELGAILGHEMDRLTPFRAEELFWSWHVTRRDRAAGRLWFQLSLIPKAGVQALLETLRQADLDPVAFEAASPGGPRRIGIAPPGTGGAAVPAWTRRLAWACAGAALAACLLPWVMQEWALERVDAELAALRPRLALVDALRQRIDATQEGAGAFAAEAARSGNALQALAALTRALPDDTYLTSLTLRERTLTLTGRSAAAVRLIAAISAQPALRDPAFAAPVTRVTAAQGGGGDEFSIRADIAP